MKTSTPLRVLVRRLPFALDDADALVRLVERWMRYGHPRDRKTLDLWTYCAVWRYFLGKVASGHLGGVSDVDDLVARAFRKTCASRTDIREAQQYERWVAVICRNTFINYRSRSVRTTPLHTAQPSEVSEPPAPYDDTEHVLRVLERAIADLPGYLREPARMLFLERRSSHDVSRAIGKPEPTVRAYKSRALHTLRRNTDLREAVDLAPVPP